MIDILISLFEILGALLFPLGQLARLSFSFQQVSVYPYELCMAVSLLFMMLKYRLSVFNKTTLSKKLLFFFISLTVSFIVTAGSYSLYDNTVGILYLIRLIFYFIHFLYLSEHILAVKQMRRTISREMIFLVIVILISSLLQYIFYPNLRNLLYEGWDPHLYRVFSFFFEPYLAGGALGLSILYLASHWKAVHRMFYVKWSVIIIMFVLLMLTFSRTVYLAILVTSVVYFLRRGKPLYIAFLFCLFIILAILIPKPVGVGVQLFRTFSIETRLNNAKEGISLWLRQPFLGVGYNRIRYKKAELGLALEYGSSHAAANYHSSFVTMLASGGIVGLALFLIVLLSLAEVSGTAGYYILFLSIISLGDNALLHPFMLYLLLRLIALERRQSSLV